MSKNLLHDTGSERLKKRIAQRKLMQGKAHESAAVELDRTRKVDPVEHAAGVALDVLAHTPRSRDANAPVVPGVDESPRKRNRAAARALHTGSVAPTPAPVRRRKEKPITQTPERIEPKTPEQTAAEMEARKAERAVRRVERLSGLMGMITEAVKAGGKT